MSGRRREAPLDESVSTPDFATESRISPDGVLAALRAAEHRFEKVFEASPLAISISTLREGRILDVNPTFAQWLGYEREEMLGRTSAELEIWKDPLARTRVAERLRRDGLVRNLDIEYRTRDGLAGVALVSLARAEFDGEDCILAVATDITERKKAERRLQLLQDVSRSIAEAEDLTAALVQAVRQICLATEWVYGEAWVPARNAKRLILGGAWHRDDTRLAALHRVARRMSLGAGEALPGQVWRAGSSIWIPDLATVDHPHEEEARAAGLRAATAVPALVGRGVAAALVFYMDVPRARDPELIELVAAVAAQLGSRIRRRQVEDPASSSVAAPHGATAFRASPAPQWIAALEDGEILEVSRGFERLYGHAREEAVGHREVELDLWVDPADRFHLRERVIEGRAPVVLPVRLRTRAGDALDVCLSAETLTVDGRECLVVAAPDISERRRYERELQRQALHDVLTGLPNRMLFEDRIRQALARACREAGRVAVLALDLDRFHAINDSLGHAAGDRLLVAVSRRLRNSLREHDTVARVGGDQFGILLEEVEDDAEARGATERLSRVFEAPFLIQGSDVHLGASVGMALSSPRLSEPEDLLRAADAAMHRAKDECGTSVRFYEPEADRGARDRFELENDLRRALAEDQLQLHYQPIVSLRSGAIDAAEALIRWSHPERGLLLPHEFFPVAEESGLVFPVGEWVVAESVARIEAWRREGLVHSEFRLAFNLSPRQFHRPGLLDLFARLLREYEVPPRCLQIEITESLALSDPETVAELRRLDLHVVIDDVGTGYSSLENLVRLDVDGLKIDRTFIRGLVDAPREDAVVEALVLLARRLSIPVVAEGVETIAQLNRLRALGCCYAQGYFFSRPLTLPVFESLLARRPRW